MATAENRAAIEFERQATPARSVGAGSRAMIIGFAWAALTVAIFSGWFVITRFSVTRELRVWDITALRFGIGAVLLSPTLLRRATRPSAAGWRQGLLFSVLWGAPFVILVAIGLRLTSAAQAASITPTLTPVFAGLLGWLFLRQRPAGGRLIGYAAIAAGLTALVAAGAVAHGAPTPLGILALMLASAMWSVYTLLFGRSGMTPIQSAALICFWSAAIFIPIYLALGLSRIAVASPREVAIQALFQGVLMSAVAVVTFNRAIAALGAAAATAMIALLPAVASLLAIPVLGEVPSLAEAVAIAFVVAGVVLAARPAPKPIARMEAL